MQILLEVIVTSVHEAIEAELGGADRLELVEALEHGGLTPKTEVAAEVLRKVSIPVRVMLRESASMSIFEDAEIRRLRARAEEFAALPINGLVLGFIKKRHPDLEGMIEILAGAPQSPVTFHRAFDLLNDRIRGIETLKRIPQIDRVLTNGGEGSWQARKMRLFEWQRACAPRIAIIFAIGNRISEFSQLSSEPGHLEVHVGRAARSPHSISGVVRREQVAAVKRALAGATD
jgi:copper homeostasis protein